MGSAIAMTLKQTGHTVSAYNRSAEKLTALARQGINTSTTPANAIENAQCILTLLTDDTAIQDVLFRQTEPRVLAGKTLIQMATISPEQSQQLAADCEKIACDYLECPVLGSIPEAQSARLILMVGASRPQYEIWHDFLTSLGPNPVYLGEVGHAAAVKLAMNHLIGALTTAFSTSLAYIQGNNVDIASFMTIVRESALYAPTYDKKLPRMLSNDFTQPNFTTKHLLKDLDLFLSSMTEQHLDGSTVTSIKEIVAKTINSGFANADYSALYTAIQPPDTHAETTTNDAT